MLVLVLVLTLLLFADPYLETHHQNLEKFASVLIKQPVSVRKITIRNNGFEPVLKLYDVAIFDAAKTKVLLQAQELQVGIDLIGSLFKWNIKPGLLVVRDANFFIHRDKNKGLYVSGIKGIADNSATAPDSTFAETLKWLFEQSNIDLSDIALTWRLANGELLKFNSLNLKLHNGVLQHELKINGSFVQKRLPTKFEARLKLRGDILKQEISSLTGDVIVEDCLFKVPERFSGGGFFVPQTGNINLLIKRPEIVAKFFRKPLTADSLEGRIIWQDTKDNLVVEIDNFKYQDNWLAILGSLQFLFPSDKQSPIVDMQLEFSLADLAKAKLYYPVTQLPPDAIVWLDKAFVSSKPIRGSMILRGPLTKFPFDHNEGRFLAEAKLRDVHLNYDDAWPSLENINGKMTFAGRSMLIVTHAAKIMHTPVGSIKASIPDLDLPVLRIDSSINSNSRVGLRFVNSSPLKQTLAKKLQTINLTGPMQLDLKMLIPLTMLVSQKDTKIDGSIVLHDNYLQPSDLNFGLSKIRGELRFTENNLVAEELSGELFKLPVSITIDTLKTGARDTITKITMNGGAAIKDIEKAFSIKLNPCVTGDFKYQALLELHDLVEENVFKLHSDMHGIAVDLPEPFAKEASSKSKLNFAYYFGKNVSQMIINYNDQINAALAKKGGEIKFGGTPAKIPSASGIAVSGHIKKLDWSVWHNYLAQIKNNFAGAGSTIRQVSLDVDELRALGQVFKKIALQAKSKSGGWEIMLSMPTIQGKIFFSDGAKAQVQGVFQKLYLNSGEQQKNTTQFVPQDLPPLHFTINDFRYDNRKFNKVEFITNSQPKGLEISKIAITDPKFDLIASGDWLVIGAKQRTVLRGKIRSVDIGGLLKQLELTNDLVGGEGEADFALKWPAAPYKPTLAKIDGTFVVSASGGQIVNFSGKTEAKLGLSRFLNLLSLRHLSLDLGDLTKKGFGFDKLEGDFEITSGNAFAKKIMLDGPIAQVKARGRIGLAAQNYDINLSVTPHITSSVPIAAAFLGGPIVGVLSWVVADQIIAPVINKATTYAYHITGGWDNPTIKKI